MDPRRNYVTRQHVGKHYSEGARHLGRSLRKSKLSYRDAALRLEMEVAQLHRVVWGDAEPTLKQGLSIRDEFGTPLELWAKLVKQEKKAS